MKHHGYDIDNELEEHKIDVSKRVYEAPGSVMTFVTIVEVVIGKRYQELELYWTKCM